MFLSFISARKHKLWIQNWKTQSNFADDDFYHFLTVVLENAEFIRLALSSDKSSLTNYYIEWIDQLTIEWLFNEVNRVQLTNFGFIQKAHLCSDRIVNYNSTTTHFE